MERDFRGGNFISLHVPVFVLCLHDISIYHFCMGETGEIVSLHWQQSKCQLWVNCFMCLMNASFERGPQSLEATPPHAIIPSVLTIPPLPVRQKWTGTSHTVPHTRHNSEPALSRSDSPLGCLHLALSYRYHVCVEETWEHVPVHRQQSKYQLWANCFMCWMPVSNAGLESRGNSATRYYSECPNHSSTTRPSKMDWH